MADTTGVKSSVGSVTLQALDDFNKETGNDWNLGTPWKNVADDINKFISNQLFPKLSEVTLKQQKLGNRFDWLANEVDVIGQLSEEYIILDTVPTTIDLSHDTELFYKEHYPNMASNVYGSGQFRKVKFTLNTNDLRFNFQTLGQGVKYALQVYQNAINAINLDEERQLRALMVDYAVNQIDHSNKAQYRKVTDVKDLVAQLGQVVLNLQNNSDKYNEAYKIAPIGRHTTHTNLKDMMILTTDNVKSEILSSVLANTFQASGIDLTGHIISFDDLGGVYRLTDDVNPKDPTTIQTLQVYGQYNVGDTIPKGRIFTFDVSSLADFNGKVEEIKPNDDNFAFILDINAVRYNRYTKNMIVDSFFNGETGNWNHWLHYYSQKKMSPFYNKVVLSSAD